MKTHLISNPLVATIILQSAAVHSMIVVQIPFLSREVTKPSFKLQLASSSQQRHQDVTIEGEEEEMSSSFNNNNNNNNNINMQLIGTPNTIKQLQSGGLPTKAYRKNVAIQDNITLPSSNFTIERVSNSPDVFILRDFLSNYECDSIINFANNNSTMTNAETITDSDLSSRKKCKVAWLPSSSSASSSPSSSVTHENVPFSLVSIISNLVSSTATLLLSQEVLKDPTASVEDLQVLKYDLGGEFVLHHDGEPRILTVIYYLNGVGGTWFPLASTSNNDPCKTINETKIQQQFINSRKAAAAVASPVVNLNSNDPPRNKANILEIGKGFKPGEQGVLVKGRTNKTAENKNDDKNPNIAWIKKGDAIAFYNYKTDGTGDLDWRALHTGLPTTNDDGTKWIANHWFRLGSLREEDE